MHTITVPIQSSNDRHATHHTRYDVCWFIGEAWNCNAVHTTTKSIVSLAHEFDATLCLPILPT